MGLFFGKGKTPTIEQLRKRRADLADKRALAESDISRLREAAVSELIDGHDGGDLSGQIRKAEIDASGTPRPPLPNSTPRLLSSRNVSARPKNARPEPRVAS